MPLIIFNTYEGDGKSIYDRMVEIGCSEFNFLVVGNLNWDDDMTPWYCPPLSENDTPCTVTDPYKPLESKYKRTRTLLEELKDSGIKLTISTRSDLILRDLDLIKTFKNARVSFSINTLDEDFKKDMDKGASIERRLNAMKELYKMGFIHRSNSAKILSKKLRHRCKKSVFSPTIFLWKIWSEKK